MVSTAQRNSGSSGGCRPTSETCGRRTLKRAKRRVVALVNVGEAAIAWVTPPRHPKQEGASTAAGSERILQYGCLNVDEHGS